MCSTHMRYGEVGRPSTIRRSALDQDLDIVRAKMLVTCHWCTAVACRQGPFCIYGCIQASLLCISAMLRWQSGKLAWLDLLSGFEIMPETCDQCTKRTFWIRLGLTQVRRKDVGAATKQAQFLGTLDTATSREALKVSYADFLLHHVMCVMVFSDQ